MNREQMVSLIKKSIKEQIELSDYSTIYYKIRIANNYTEGGVFNKNNDEPIIDYMMKYLDRLDFFRLYNDSIPTSDKFNIIEIYFDCEMNPTAQFAWDQAYYDADIEGNKNLKGEK